MSRTDPTFMGEDFDPVGDQRTARYAEKHASGRPMPSFYVLRERLLRYVTSPDRDPLQPYVHFVGPAAFWEWLCSYGPVIGSLGATIPPPKTKADCDELRRQVLDLPDGFLAKLYVDLYESKDLRIDSAKSTAKTYYGGLA